ncbi:hypothetical protein MCP_1873 [Methanocella paludicola SANAE]|uniref:Uncharacterized protein n=1 Tax=Methanocella paludicola (strain DSM 17711 / JCM 13418 / NBRC 101707 / SANAE) TaxID=304371 RepID=D1YZS3_METPS|nr:hypothetical protein [Methanocella paludicola]BAI61945.1 hypothetical protein MCP_1873 [Methanocella paludicola SANAE]
MYERLIDEYVGKVTKDMGAKQRDEVGNELKAHIYDSAEAITAKRGAGVDEAAVQEVLSKMMAPEKLAAMYPSKETFLRKSGVWKAVQALAGIAVAFLLLAAIIYAVAPEAAGISVGVILSVVSALALAIVALVAIFFLIYLYESRLKLTYEARLCRLVKSLEYPASPLEVGIVIALSVFGLIFILLLWPYVPFLADFGTGRLVPLFSPAFATFVPYYVLWLVAEIAVQLLYLALRQKWVPSLAETGLSLASALLTLWVLQAFPFNLELSVTIQAGIKVLLALCILGTLIDAAQKLWQTARFFIYGDFRNTPVD